MKFRGYRGFALPTILIVSVILMSVLVVASVSVAGVRSTMAAQYYNQIAKNASEAGIAYAKACVKVNGGVAQWSDAKPLRPFTDCSGTTILNSSDPNYYVSGNDVNDNAKVTFSVGYPSVDSAGNYTVFKANGSVDLVRTSNGAVWRTYSQNTTSSTAYVDDGLPLGTSLSGYWSTAPEGYLFEDGSAVSRTTYADLFELIGTTFGSGDGSTTFNLPDSRGRASVNINDLNPGDYEFDTLGEKYGAKIHTLSIDELPNHTHTYAYRGGTTSLYTGVATPNRWRDQQGRTSSDVGGGLSHNNIQPSIVKTYAIKYLKPENHNSELPVGSSIEGYWPISDIPSGYLYENGASVSCSTYPNLGATLGYSGCSTTFNLPDSRGRVAVNKSSESEFNSIGLRNGEKTHLLTIPEMPSHTHTIDTIYVYPVIAQAGATYANMWVNQVTATTGAAGGGQAHNNIQPSIVKVSVVKYTDVSVGSSSLPVGTSISGYWNDSDIPNDYSLENGSTVSRTVYSSLFNTLSTTYGVGDGSTTFNLPDSRGRVAVNLNSGDAEFDTLGEKNGSKTVTLNTTQIPSHNHSYYSYVTIISTGYTSSTSNTWQAQLLLQSGSTGGNGGHNNIQPYIVKNSAIKLTGGVTASGVNLLTDSGKTITGTCVISAINLSSIFNQYGSRQYTMSFDISSSTTGSAILFMRSSMVPNCDNIQNDSRYTFSPTINPSVSFSSSSTRKAITFTPLLTNTGTADSMLYFYNETLPLSIKNIKIELGSKATAWTPALGEVKALVVGGGASGGGSVSASGGGGGGGAGGLRYSSTLLLNTQASYAVTVGAGGPAVSGAFRGNGGGESSFAGLVAYGGGGGGAGSGTLHTGLPTSAGWSGSGGGAGYNAYALSTPGYGTSGQGYNGGQNGATSYAGGGGGGGAGGVGGTGRVSHCGGLPGVGRSIDISGSSVTYSTGGYGGGCVAIASGAANTGDGGGAVYGNTTTTSGAGGSGIVIVSYPTGSMIATGGDITYSGGYTIHTFRSSGTFTVQSIAS